MPAVDVPFIKAKLDTGARSSSLHADDIETFTDDGHEWVRCTLHPWQRTTDDSVTIELPVVDRRTIRSSTGHEEERLVVATSVRLLDVDIPAELTLTNRDEMGFRMLIGREALRRRFLVDSGRSYRGGRPPREVRRRNRGRPPT